MSKLLIQDDIINGMDVYVEYTIDTDGEIVLYDYGLELDNPNGSLTHTSLRGYTNTRWMEERLLILIDVEESY